MLKLEEISIDAQVNGLIPDDVVTVIQVRRVGDGAVNVTYETKGGDLGKQMLFRTDESRLSLAQSGRTWGFDADGNDFKLGLEAYRINLAHLFDPMVAVHTSNVEPLPHQITAVYESMLPRQPLRFVLADDPGAGKTIMAGLLIQELLMRADAQRILIVSPGSLSEQWLDELYEKFGLEFDVFSKAKMEQSASGNYFEDKHLVIARLDQISRNEEYQEKLKQTRWDLIVVDEAHKLSAHYFGGKVNKSKRFQLGELLAQITRHFLLMTATPHNGKEEDFQLFLSLLDGDRFYGKFREGVHKVDTSDMMRRMVKEDLLKFDGRPLFPERRAYTVNYELSNLEAALYTSVTDYVRNEMNRADQLDGKRKGNVGFALTQLQRRLASSPEAIFQSLKRRRERLRSRLEEVKLLQRGGEVIAETMAEYGNKSGDEWEAEEEMANEEYERWVDEVMDRATAANTIHELETEIFMLEQLVEQARSVVQSGNDKKWEELSRLLQDTPEMYVGNSRRKLIIFTEHKDTLNYLKQRISQMLGNPDAIRVIYGGVNRDDRRKIQEEFRNSPDVLVLVATDAAGEGVNLQNANLMINYDLPWNPNRLEQRFGRIHRIGQTEVCHLWNLVASETREGEVFQKLFAKLEVEKEALGGRVFDILGEAFEGVSLKDLLIEAIRFGESDETRARLDQKLEGALDHIHLSSILQRNALVEQHMGLEQLYLVKEEMEKAEARRLQPYFIRAFFTKAFAELGGQLKQRETERYEIKHVPATIMERDRVMSALRTPVLKKYERVCFEKQKIRQVGKPMADLVHPAHPLMAAVTDLMMERFRPMLKQGAILLDPADPSTTPRMLFMVEHTVRESSGANKVVSQRLQFVEIDSQGECKSAGWAPHLDLEAMEGDDLALTQDVLKQPWLQKDLEQMAFEYASVNLVQQHFSEIKERRERHVDKIYQAVHERLVKEINYLSGRALQLEEDVALGKQPRIQPIQLKREAEKLTARLEQRERELKTTRNVVSNAPVVLGGALVIPQGLLDQLKGDELPDFKLGDKQRIERIAMEAVLVTEQALGNQTKDVSAEKCGWDITSTPPGEDGKLSVSRHIEVKGRVQGATTVTVTKNEILYALNQQEQFLLAIVLVNEDDSYEGPYYLRNPFTQEPDWAETSKNLELRKLLERAELAV